MERSGATGNFTARMARGKIGERVFLFAVRPSREMGGALVTQSSEFSSREVRLRPKLERPLQALHGLAHSPDAGLGDSQVVQRGRVVDVA